MWGLLEAIYFPLAPIHSSQAKHLVVL